MQISYKQPKNLKRIVTQKKKVNRDEQNPGCSKCGRCRVSCPIIKEGGTFSSTNTQKTYRIRQKLDCNSSYVIYLATFLRCGEKYVGKSKPLSKLVIATTSKKLRKKWGVWGNIMGGMGVDTRTYPFRSLTKLKWGTTGVQRIKKFIGKTS